MISIYMLNLKYDTMNLSMKQKQTHKHREETCGCQGGEREGLGVWGQQTETSIYGIDQQQEPTIQHKELYTISCDES